MLPILRVFYTANHDHSVSKLTCRLVTIVNFPRIDNSCSVVDSRNVLRDIFECFCCRVCNGESGSDTVQDVRLILIYWCYTVVSKRWTLNLDLLTDAPHARTEIVAHTFLIYCRANRLYHLLWTLDKSINWMEKFGQISTVRAKFDVGGTKFNRTFGVLVVVSYLPSLHPRTGDLWIETLVYFYEHFYNS